MSKTNSIVFLVGLTLLALGIKLAEYRIREMEMIVDTLQGKYKTIEEVLIRNNQEIGDIKDYLNSQEYER